ncbi:MAG: nucleotide sugar dehydrogenase [Thermoleophilaceae bacterium]
MGDREPIGVIGVGWVGLVTAACFAELGHEVWARDIVPEKVESLSRGEVPIHEPGLPELVAKNAARLHFTTDMGEVLERTRLLFVCVDTPPTYSGDADLSRIEAVMRELGESSEHVMVMKSTVPVGTGRSIQRRRPGTGYVSNPEFLKEGSAVSDFIKPDRVVVGADDGSAEHAERVSALYAPLDAPVVSTDVASAEMIKLASNAFLATKISFINEIANVSEELGADVLEVARGMGLDDRIGSQFLRAGIGYGGSCLAGEETVLARHHGRTTLITFEQLWRRLEEDGEEQPEHGVITPGALEVLSFPPEQQEPIFLPVMCVTRRDYVGELLEVRTKMGRRVRCTPDHPFLVTDADGAPVKRVLAKDLTEDDWLPIAMKRDEPADSAAIASILSAVEAAELSPEQLIVRPAREEVAALVARPIEDRREVFTRTRSAAARTGDVKRTGTIRFDEACLGDVSLRGARFGTARNGNYVRNEIGLDEQFWRVVGLYIAEGCASRTSLLWSFHRDREDHLVDEVIVHWSRHGLVPRVYLALTSKQVRLTSRLVASWWIGVLGLGRNSYGQRLPDLIWDRPKRDKWALLSGLFEGDGSWSLQNGGPSVVIEFGTISDELADGVLRLLGELGIVATRRIGRTAKSTKDTHWIRICGAEQVERAIDLIPHRDRVGALASVARQSKQIAPTGYRRRDDASARVRVVDVKRERFRGPVFSLEVPGAHSFVAGGGSCISNCFPKDVQALKQLAGNSGYHFQLLTAVIEVNELQKRRTIGKLQKHLGSLVGKEVALLGVAFKPHTDDIREATSLVLSGRLQGEGASVRVYDPVAADRAGGMLGGARICESTLEAVEGADAVVLVTEWPEFGELDWANDVKSRMRVPLVVDGRNFLDRDELEGAGFTYEGIGR